MSASGILNVNKPTGATSFRIVSLVRRGSGAAKVGHAGTLDPAASGVLLVCLGQAVRVSEYLMELPKVYRAIVHLGVATDTYDSEGVPVSRGDPSGVNEGDLRAALGTLVGDIEQTPPSFSALKVGGRPAYRLAREGRPAALAPRPVRISRIELLAFPNPEVEIEVECGKGTYIRSLAHDLGQRLGCGAYLRSLVRLRVGPFTVDEAVRPERLEAAFADGDWQGLLLPMDRGLEHLEAVALGEAEERDVNHGRPLAGGLPAFGHLATPDAGQRCRAYGADGSFLAVLRYDDRGQEWRPEKVFRSAS